MSAQEIDNQLALRLGWTMVETTMAAPHVDGWGKDLPGPDPGYRVPGEPVWEGSQSIFGYRLKVSRDYSCGPGWWEPTRSLVQSAVATHLLSGGSRDAYLTCMEALAS